MTGTNNILAFTPFTVDNTAQHTRDYVNILAERFHQYFSGYKNPQKYEKAMALCMITAIEIDHIYTDFHTENPKYSLEGILPDTKFSQDLGWEQSHMRLLELKIIRGIKDIVEDSYRLAEKNSSDTSYERAAENLAVLNRLEDMKLTRRFRWHRKDFTIGDCMNYVLKTGLKERQGLIKRAREYIHLLKTTG